MLLAHGLPPHRVVVKRWRRVRLNIQGQLEARVQNMCGGHSVPTSSRQDPLQNCIRVEEHVRLVPHVSETYVYRAKSFVATRVLPCVT